MQEGLAVRTVLWWGRFDANYSRNRILRKVFAELSWQIRDFHPRFSGVADWEARLHRLPKPHLVWVPCFRQRDLAAASRWAKSHNVPLIFDPLISAYDKQVDERGKLDASSSRAQRLLAWERSLLQRADKLVADTPAHADYFSQVLGVARENISVVYVGAEETLFAPQPPISDAGDSLIEVLFYGSFIPLQAPQVVIEAARLYQGPPVKWVFLGQGPLRSLCEEAARNVTNVTFEDWVAYEKLPTRISQADILLGVFGTTPKAGRVIPNKVFQSLACAKPVITRSAEAYPDELLATENSGLAWVPAGDARSLADCVANLASHPETLRLLSEGAVHTSQHYFSASVVRQQLAGALADLHI
jgi:glycosyltransferase involved in cell wall biosynthesis